MPCEIPFAIHTHFVVKGLAASDQAVCEAMRIAFNRLTLALEPSRAAALACLLENKEKFKGTRTLVMLSGGNVDQKTFGECLAKAIQ
mgnify:CR=1 FL=1